ncbi:MAG: hypothetical protein U0805_08825 [Pirellulales bacterium]
MTVDPTQITLNAAQQVRVALLAEATGKSWSVVVDELLDTAPQSSASASTVLNGENPLAKSLFDVLSERGILGCFDGPTDLSTNPKHMEGFGEFRTSTNPN